MTDQTYGLAVLEVHLDAVARNWLFLKKKMAAGADCGAVVKADAYGLGAIPVAQALFAQGCRHFFVAHFEEGVAVRQALSSSEAQIYVLSGLCGAAAEDFSAHRLIPVLNTLSEVESWAAYGARNGQKQPCLLHLDTGMNRLGLSEKETQALCARRDLLAALDLRYVMSHLACADTPDHPLNRQQLESFRALAASLQMPLRLSLANSAGILLSPDYHFDLTRPGCALYGISPQTGFPNPMQGAVTARARILQIREIDRAGTVGYGATKVVSPPATCAVISVGYADGYLRSLTGRGSIVIGGKKRAVLGRVSMDTVVVDVTGLDAKAGDWAEIIGPAQTVDDLAAAAGTIGYEILTSLGKRYKRIYTGAA